MTLSGVVELEHKLMSRTAVCEVCLLVLVLQ